MSTVRRYTAEEMRDMARKIHARKDLPIDRAANAKMLRQAAEREARVTWLVEALEDVLTFSNDPSVIRMTRIALSKFRGEDA